MSDKNYKTAVTEKTVVKGSSEAPDIDLLAKLMAQFAALKGADIRLDLDASNRLVVVLPNGERVAFEGTQLLVQALAGRFKAFAEELRAGQVDIDRVLQGLQRQQTDQQAWDDIVFKLDRMLSDVVPKDGSLSWKNVGFSAEGHLTTPYAPGKIGRGIGHLPGLPGEDFIFGNDQNRLTEVARLDAQATDPREEDVRDSLAIGGIGSSLVHLPPMPDGSRIIVGDRTFSPFPDNRFSTGTDVPRNPVYQPPASRDDLYRVDENGRITASVLDNDAYPNGFGTVTLVGSPPPGAFVLNPNGTFEYQPPDGLSGTVTFIYTFTDPVTLVRVESQVTLIIAPLADAPANTTPALPFRTEEDTPITLTGVSGALVDTDGSETITYRIEGVPPDSSFNGVGTDLGNGVWTFTAADLLNPLVFVPATNQHGVFNLTFSAIAQETANADTAVTTRPFTIIVDAQADVPTGAIAAIAGNEDALIVVGDKISFGTQDTDGSEWVSSITIAGLPAGWTTAWTPNAAVTVTGTAQTGYVISVAAKADAALLRALVDTFAVQAPLNSDVDSTLAVTVTTTDADGSTATSGTVSTPIVIAPLSDAPTVNTTNASGEEDTHILFGDKITFVKPDNDGSESISQVEITGFGSAIVRNVATPAGPLTGVGAAVITVIAGGYRITGSEADIRATLDTLTVRQVTNSDADITLAITAQTRDGVAVASTNGTGSQTIIVDAQADVTTPTFSAFTVNEDTLTTIGNRILWTKADNDGSEWVSSITIGALPVGWTTAWTANAAVTVTGTAQTGYVISVAAKADEAALRTLVSSFRVRAPANSDADSTLSVTLTTTDADGSTATSGTASTAIVVNPVSDRPTVNTIANVSGEEDTHILFGDKITFTKPDDDGSEQISSVSITGFGSATVRNVGAPGGPLVGISGATITTIAGGYTISGTEAAIRATLDTLTVRQVTNSDADITLTVTAKTKDGAAAESASSTSKTQLIIVDAQADTPVPTIAAVSGNEDTLFVVGNKITFGTQDTDGSEWVSSITIAALPAGWTTAWTPNAAVTVTGTAQTGYVISVATKTNASLLRALVDTFAVQAPLNSDVDSTLAVTVTTTDADGSTATSGTVSTPIVILAVADTPSSVASNTSGNEDVFIPLTLSSGISGDTDGSETRTVSITGVPAGATFNVGTVVAGVWTGTAAQLAGLEFKAPTQFSGPINMVLVTRSTETDGGSFADASAPFTVTIAPILDSVALADSSQTIDEDTTIPVGAQFNIGLIDLDGSQNLTYTISGIPAGYTVTSSPTGTASMSALSGGSVTFSGTNANDVINAIRTMNLVVTGGGAAAHKDTNFTLSISASTSENAGGGTSSGTAIHAVQVSARADLPTVGSTAVLTHNEDPASPIAFPITAVLTDLDGSEELTRVDVTIANFATAIASINYNTGLPGTATALPTGIRFEGTTAQIQALLASVTITPRLHSDVDFVVSVAATVSESNPTEVGAGEVSLLNATRTTTFNVTMNAVADQPSVSAPAVTTPFLTQEDQPIAITSLTGALVDTDGSETLTFQIRDVPAGSSFSSGTNIGGGVWTFTAAQLAANPVFTPPSGASGTYDLTLRAIATETAGGAMATNDSVFRIVVDPEADTPNLSATATINEDTATVVGTGIVYALNDTDGSEYINQVTIAALPAGWVASFATTHPNVTITGSALAGFTVSISSASDATNLRNVINSLTVTAAPQSDADVSVTVTARAIDLDGSQAIQTTSLPITVRAIADAPVATGNDVSGVEDTVVALSLSATMGSDTDGTETLSARILGVPAGAILLANTAGGGTFTSIGGGIWTVAAPSTAQLNAILGSVTMTPPENLHGPVVMQLEVTSTEAASGGQVQTKTAVTTDSFTVNLTAVADVPTLQIINATGGSAGYEDTPIPLLITGTGLDLDGSEVLTYKISDVPTGATFENAGGAPVGTLVSPGVYSFTAAELVGLRIKPPLNSSADFTLQVTVRSTENAPGNPGNGDFEEVTLPLQVAVIGVADLPTLTVPPVISPEDQPIPLGSTIVGALADTDGSETLFYIISGLPAGVVPSVGTYIGGEWQVAAGDIAGMTIPVPPNFSGNYTATYAPNLKVRAVAQENDGDQIFREAPLNVTITPVMDAFPGWTPSIMATEDGGISLASAAFSGLSDGDGSEAIAWYEFNLSTVIANAQISANVASTADLIANFVTGTFTNQGGGIIRVLAADLAGVALRATAFLDANVDFTIPVTAHVTESGGLTQNVSGTYSINLVGDADTPTTYAQDVAGITGQAIRLNPNTPTGLTFGGDITDTDVAQGRSSSERIYYIVSGMDSTPGLKVAFVNSAGALVGLNNNDGTWYLTKQDMQDLHIISRFGDVGSVNLQLTSITVENDGDLAQSVAPVNFQATFAPDSGGGGGVVIPQTPVIAITPMTANEDGAVTFTVTVSPGPGEPPALTPSVVLLIGNLPPGATIVGATFNPSTGRYIATEADLASGNVVIRPPANFSGAMNVTVEAVATNTQLNVTTTGPQVVGVTVIPVADGPSINASPAAGAEDTATALNITVGLTDTDAASPETLQSPIRITVSNGATLSAGTALGGGVYELTPAQLAGLTITPPNDFHGPIAVSVQATSIEPSNGDTRQTTSNFTVNVAPVPDAPNATANNVSGTEDSVIAMTGLSASLNDLDGSERLSVKIFGIPEGSILSAGGNNGDGSWTIPVAALAALTIKPPRDYSGVMSLSLEAYALEANGVVGTTTVPFTVTVTPVGDAITLNAQVVVGPEDQPIALNLGLATQDTNGTNPGENAGELVELTFTDLRAGSDILATLGGALVRLSATSVQFTGTLAQANALAYQSALHDSINDTVNVSAVAIDGTSRGTATVGSFLVRVVADADEPTVTGFTAGLPTTTGVALNLAATFPDMDGSETHTILISGMPLTASLNAGTNLGGGVWELTPAQLSGLEFTPAAGGGTVTLSAQAKAVETINNDTALSAIVPITFTTGDGTANTVAGTASADLVYGLAGNDTLGGSGGADTIYGGTGNDSLTGGADADTLLGGDDDDVLVGGLNADILTGGSGADTLVWASGDLGGGIDTVTDFATGAGGDRLNLSALLTGFTAGVTPVTGFVQFVEAAGNTTINIDADGGGDNFSSSVAILQGVTGLNAETMRLNGTLIV